MKQTFKWGLILQIPNIILLVFGFAFLGIKILVNNINNIGSLFNFESLFWIVLGTFYGLANIGSIILFASSIEFKNKISTKQIIK